MARYAQTIAPALTLLAALAGCSSSSGGGNQLENTVYATHRLVQNLDRNLASTVTQLNETAAELVARVDSADQASRQLLSIVQENQVKLENLQRRLDELTVTLYRHLNLTPPSSGVTVQPPISSSPSGFDSGTVIVEPPTTTVLPPLTTPRAEIEHMPVAETIASGSAGDADTYYLRARDLYNSEQYDQALEQFDSYLRLFPDSANSGNAQYWKAHSYFKLNRFDRAIEEFNRLESQYPSSDKIPIALHNEAVAYSRLNQRDNAIATFERLVRDYPNDVVADMARENLRQLQENP